MSRFVVLFLALGAFEVWCAVECAPEVAGLFVFNVLLSLAGAAAVADEKESP